MKLHIRRFILPSFLVAVLALNPAQALPAPLDAPASPHRQFEPTGLGGEFDPAVRPAGANPNQPVDVIVQLTEAPVTVTKGSAADLQSRQESVKAAIAGQGGTILKQYQYAINGFAVQIPKDKVAGLARLPGVRAVKPSRIHEVDNIQSVPFLGTPMAWQGVDGLRGEGVKVAIIDTGIDYTHANFGGPGTVEAFNKAKATSTQPADPDLFGPNSKTKVKGGTDLVGDDYDASSDDPAKRIPHPDPNPLDCHGHGSHVAGTAAGFGVGPGGKTFDGPYDLTTYTNRPFKVGPGVAPRAELYAVRVFGCDGSASTAVVVEAIEWTIKNNMDVVNMSLGSPFGTGDLDDPEAEAVDNAALAGVLVVASAGNGGTGQYITGRPASATKALSVAASESKPEYPGVVMDLSTRKTINAINANNRPVPPSLPVIVLRDPGGAISLGCKDTDYPATVTGKLVVSRRGSCARVDRAILAQKHGALAAAMINSDSGYPPFEGPIRDPALGTVTIPFLGVRGTVNMPTSDGSLLVAAHGGTTTLTAKILANPNYKGLASFSSSGPRFGDSWLKPEVTAPGVSILSTAIGTGNEEQALSGTSMAAPHVTGVAALVSQAHPEWDVLDVKAAIVNTALPDAVARFTVRRAGAGLVQPLAATKTKVVTFSRGDTSTLSFGFDSDAKELVNTLPLRIANRGSEAVTFNLSATTPQGAPHSLSFSRATLTVPAHDDDTVDVTLRVAASTVGNADAFREVGGIVTLTPSSPNSNGGVSLRVPYYLVPRALSMVDTHLQGELSPATPMTKAEVTNKGGGIPGTADFYAWGLVTDGDRNASGKPFELRAAGVQSFPGENCEGEARPTDGCLIFAINTLGRWSNAAPYEFDVLFDVDGHGFLVFGFDVGLTLSGAYNGQVGAFVQDLATGKIAVDYFAFAPTNTNTIELPILFSRIGLSTAHPRVNEYVVGSFDKFSPSIFPDDVLPGIASFNAFSSAISTGQFVKVAPNATALVNVSLNLLEATRTPAKGLMVVTVDNDTATGDQAQLIDVPMVSSPSVRGAQAATARLTRLADLAHRPTRMSKLSSAR